MIESIDHLLHIAQDNLGEEAALAQISNQFISLQAHQKMIGS